MLSVRQMYTLDTFFDSSWYYLRFCSPKSQNAPFSEQEINYWMPVDHYIQVELNMLFFIYCIHVSFSRALKYCGYKVPKEPFTKLITQGMVCHETFKTEDNKWIEPNEVENENDNYWAYIENKKVKVKKGRSEKMSKSKKNIVDPDSIIKIWC